MRTDSAPDLCPRCGQGFRCGAGDDTPCACGTIALDAAVLAQLRARYAACLCLACLRALASGEHIDPPSPHTA